MILRGSTQLGGRAPGSREVAMVTVNIHEAKRQLSKLVDQAVKGEAFVIAKAGKPLVRVAALDAPAAPRRLGFLEGEIAVPEDFDRMGEAEIAALFGGGGARSSCWTPRSCCGRPASPTGSPRPRASS